MGRKRKRLWGDMLGKPIERLWRRDYFKKTPALAGMADLSEKKSFVDQYRKMCRLKEHYGADCWYALALAIASEIDDGLKIIDPPPRRTDKTAPRWDEAGRKYVLEIVDCLREEEGGEAKLEYLLMKMQQLSPDHYGKMKLSTLKTRYHEAKRMNCKKSTKLGAK